MLYCYKQHLKAIPAGQVSSRRFSFSLTHNGATKLFNALAFFFALTIQQHPMLDELKWFSGQREPIPTYTLLGIVLLTVIASIVQQRQQLYKSSIDIDRSGDREGEGENLFLSLTKTQRNRWYQIFRITFDLLVSMVMGLSGLLVSMPSSLVPINMIAGFTLAELHFEESWSLLSRTFLAIISGLSMLISCIAFAKGTIYYLVYLLTSSMNTTWWGLLTGGAAAAGVGEMTTGENSGNSSVSMRQFCQWIAILVSLSVLLPSAISLQGGNIPSIWFAHRQDRSMESSGLASRGLIDDDFGSKDGQRTDRSAQATVRSLFAYGLIALSMFTMWLELLVLEQVSQFYTFVLG
jgi:hypothetical protein